MHTGARQLASFWIKQTDYYSLATQARRICPSQPPYWNMPTAFLNPQCPLELPSFVGFG
jgi:hypothetical protein